MENSQPTNQVVQYDSKPEFRRQALYVSQDINRQYQSNPSVDKILSDADKIYEWLIKDL